MKISKSLQGLSILLLAALGAFANAKSQRAITFFYQSATGGCKAIDLNKDCPGFGTGCTDLAGTGTQPKQLYNLQRSLITCESPLRAGN